MMAQTKGHRNSDVPLSVSGEMDRWAQFIRAAARAKAYWASG